MRPINSVLSMLMTGDRMARPKYSEFMVDSRFTYWIDEWMPMIPPKYAKYMATWSRAIRNHAVIGVLVNMEKM